MKVLFDTHAFIWWDGEPAKLSSKARAACEDPANELFFSVASAWEMQIKSQLGKLQLHQPLSDLVAAQQQTNGIKVLPITLLHVLDLERLPDHHRDPFDRLLIAQANVEDAVLVSHDPALSRYAVKILW